MIGLRVSSRTDILTTVDKALTNAPRQIEGINRDVATEFDTEVMPQLRRIPPPHPFQPGLFPWTSERQRRAFFASNGFGGGIPTKRTGRIADSWGLVTSRRGQTVSFTARNRHPAAQYLYGRINLRDRAAAIKPQQRFHRITGWPIAHDILAPASEKIKRRFKDLFIVAFEDDSRLKVRRRSLR